MATDVEIRLKATDEASVPMSDAADSAKELADELRVAAESAKDTSPEVEQLASELEKLADQQRAIDQFAALQLEVSEANKALAEAREETAQLAKTIKEIEEPSKALVDQFENQKQKTTELQKAQIRQANALIQLDRTLTITGVNTASLATEQASLSQKMAEAKGHAEALKSSLSQANEETKEFQESNDDATDSVDKFSGKLAAAVGGLLAFVGVAAVLKKVKDAIIGVTKTGSDFEQLKSQIDGVSGSARAGEQAFAWIEAFAEKTPGDINDVTEGFVNLKKFGIDPMNGSYQSLVDYNAKLGGGQRELVQLINTVGKAWAKQKLQVSDTLQLIQRGVPVYQILSKELGKTTEEIEQMIAKGEAGREAIDALIKAMGSSSVGAAAENMKELGGIISSLKDMFVGFKNEIADAGIFDYVKQQVSELLAKFKEMKADGSLKELAKDISNFMVKTAEVTKSVITTLVSFSGEIKALAFSFAAVKFTLFLRNLGLIAPAAVTATTAIRAMSLALISTGFGAVAVAIGFVIAKFAELRSAQSDAERSSKSAQKSSDELSAIYEKLSEKLGIHIGSTQDLRDAQEAGLITFNQTTQEFERIKPAIDAATLAQQQYKSILAGVNVDIDAQATKMVEAAQQGADFKAKLDEIIKSEGGLSGALAKLTNEGLAQFRVGLDNAISGQFIENTQATIVATALIDENLKRLGVDLELISSGMTTTGKAAVDSFRVLGETAGVTGEQILAGLGGALKKVSNQHELDKITEELAKIITQSKLTGEQSTRALNQLDVKAASLIKKFETFNSVLRDLGKDIRTADTIKELDDLAIAATDAFSQGNLTAAEYNDHLEAINNKQNILNEQLQKRIKREQEINDKLKERQGLSKKESEQQDANNKAQSDGNAVRTVSLNISEREGKARHKAFEQMRAATRQTIYGAKAIRDFYGKVNDQAKAMTNAMEAADKLAANIIKVAESTHVGEQQMAGYVRELEQAIAGGQALDDQALSNLQNALSAAKGKMEALKNETKSAKGEVAGLESELATLNGNQAKVQQIEYQQKRLDLEQKIVIAQQEGNSGAVSSYKEALSLLSQINAKKRVNIRKEQEAAASKAETAKPSASPAPTQTATIQFKAPDGKTVTGSFAKDDANKVIDLLKQAGGSAV